MLEALVCIHCISDFIKTEKLSVTRTRKSPLVIKIPFNSVVILLVENFKISTSVNFLHLLAIVSVENVLKCFPVSCHACLGLFQKL